MEEKKIEFKIGDIISGKNCKDKDVKGAVTGISEYGNPMIYTEEYGNSTLVWGASLFIEDKKPTLTDISDKAQAHHPAEGVMFPVTGFERDEEPQMTATLWAILEKTKHEATRAREYLRLTGATCTPDKVHEILHLKTSRATLARKMREAVQRGELLRVPYINERGTEIAQYAWNPNYKENK